MNDKYVKLADVKRKLRYIFKAYGVGNFVREKVERALNNLPYNVKGDLETTLEAADVQLVKHGRWIWVKDYRDCEGDIYSKYKCSCCDFGVGGIYSIEDLTHFCGNCGVRMDGDT